MNSTLLLAQAGAGGSPTSTIIFFAAIFAIMYFLMIRPQQRQLKEHRALLSALKKGDDVVTQGGMLGKIYALTDKVVTLEIANGVRVRVLLSSIQSRNAPEAEVVARGEEKKEEK